VDEELPGEGHLEEVPDDGPPGWAGGQPQAPVPLLYLATATATASAAVATAAVKASCRTESDEAASSIAA
jgi:hypothetical protein